MDYSEMSMKESAETRKCCTVCILCHFWIASKHFSIFALAVVPLVSGFFFTMPRSWVCALKSSCHEFEEMRCQFYDSKQSV